MRQNVRVIFGAESRKDAHRLAECNGSYLISGDCTGSGVTLVKVVVDGVGGFSRDDGGEGFGSGVLDVAQGAEVGEKALACLGADAGDVVELGVSIPHSPALAVVADGKAMTLVPDDLDEMEDGGAAVEDDGVVFLTVEVDDLFFFGDGGERLSGEAEFFEGFGSGVELAEAAIDKDEGGEGGGFFVGAGMGGGVRFGFRGSPLGG
jgi:hypothetical protein